MIEPLLAGLASRTIAEVGAGHGRLTARILRAATRADMTIHAIEPEPTAELLRLARTDPRVEVHATHGADALGRIGAVDLVLLDGDPNWSTTRAELDVVVARSREAGVPAPVIVVHNVHWPFGRRDGYHAADRPAASLRRPSAQAGLIPGRSRPADDGVRLVPFVALDEGGERNGVLTAVDDFLADDRGRWELVDLPGYGGTAVLADTARLQYDPQLRAVLATLRSPDAVRRAARRAEAGRIDAELRALATAADSASLDMLRASERRLERELATARAELAAARPSGAPGASPELLAAQLAALGDERDRLREEVRELLEHRAANLAGRRQLERLEAALAQHERSAAQIAAERDEQGRAAAELRVRLEHARGELDARSRALEEATGALTASRRSVEEQTRRIAELGDTERLLTGRLLHLEDNVAAAHAELAESRAATAELAQRVEHARRCERQAAELVRAARSTRRARFAGAVWRAFGRSERAAPARLERALALLDRDERGLAAGAEADPTPESDPLTAR